MPLITVDPTAITNVANRTRATNALISYYTTTNAAGQPVVPTAAQARALFEASCVKALKDIVLRVERNTAVAAANASVVVLDVT